MTLWTKLWTKLKKKLRLGSSDDTLQNQNQRTEEVKIGPVLVHCSAFGIRTYYSVQPSGLVTYEFDDAKWEGGNKALTDLLGSNVELVYNYYHQITLHDVKVFIFHDLPANKTQIRLNCAVYD